MWIASAEYADGTRVEQQCPYMENGNYYRENERQQELEEWLIGYHDNCTWYSVAYVDD